MPLPNKLSKLEMHIMDTLWSKAQLAHPMTGRPRLRSSPQCNSLG